MTLFLSSFGPFSAALGAIMGLMLIALVPAFIARMKGRGFGRWWVYAMLLWPVAMVHIMLLTDLNRAPPNVRVTW